QEAEAAQAREAEARAARETAQRELYQTQGKLAEAEPLLERSLAIRVKAFGPEHLSVGMALLSLASLYEAQNKFGEMQRLRRRSLEILSKSLGPDHPDVARVREKLDSGHQRSVDKPQPR